MPTINHNVLTSDDLHEPKGAGGASTGQVYRSTGSGSGGWRYHPQGWGRYKDNSGAQTVGTSETLLTIDGLGGGTNESYLPREIRGTDSLWDTTNHHIKSIDLGDLYQVRLDIPVSANASASELIVRADIGGGASSTDIITTHSLDLGAAPFSRTISFPFFTNSNALANGLQFFAFTDAGSIDITGLGILVARVSGNF